MKRAPGFFLVAAVVVILIGFRILSPLLLRNSGVQATVGPLPLTQARNYMLARNSRLAPEIADVIAQELTRASEEKQLPLSLLLGIVEKESLFNPFEVSKAGAQGLLQILLGEVEIDRTRGHGIRYNIEVGTMILLEKVEQNRGDLVAALAAYSGGAEGYQQDVLMNMGRFLLFQQSKKGGESDRDGKTKKEGLAGAGGELPTVE